uniref:Uncharacterized protein n=1 Tax=Cacopsylla melanoneura TaxID=428564 RepID=A0A8D9ERV7_9HEMI
MSCKWNPSCSANFFPTLMSLEYLMMFLTICCFSKSDRMISLKNVSFFVCLYKWSKRCLLLCSVHLFLLKILIVAFFSFSFNSSFLNPFSSLFFTFLIFFIRYCLYYFFFLFCILIVLFISDCIILCSNKEVLY